MAERYDEIRFFGGIWRTPGVDEQPTITLIRWRVLEVAVGAFAGQRHLIGFCRENYEGRASTPVVSFDPVEKFRVTKSGRRYLLLGPSKFDADAEYVWQAWSRNIPTIDVSSEYEMTKTIRDESAEVLENNLLSEEVCRQEKDTTSEE